MAVMTLMRTHVASAAILAFAPSLAAGVPPDSQLATIAPPAQSDGYSIAAPQATVVDNKMSAEIVATSATECANAWQVFTDFDAMPRFLPGMEASKVLSREDGRVTVLQRGRHQYGIFWKRYQSERALTMREPVVIESRSLPGDEMAIVSSTFFTPTAQAGCAITYSASIELPRWIPSGAAEGFVKSLASTQMRAMLAEVQRRYAPAPMRATAGSDVPARGASLRAEAP